MAGGVVGTIRALGRGKLTAGDGDTGTTGAPGSGAQMGSRQAVSGECWAQGTGCGLGCGSGGIGGGGGYGTWAGNSGWGPTEDVSGVGTASSGQRARGTGSGGMGSAGSSGAVTGVDQGQTAGTAGSSDRARGNGCPSRCSARDFGGAQGSGLSDSDVIGRCGARVGIGDGSSDTGGVSSSGLITGARGSIDLAKGCGLGGIGGVSGCGMDTGSGSGGTGGVGKRGTRAGNGPAGTGSIGVEAAGDGGLAWANGARADMGKGGDCIMGQGTANGRADLAASTGAGSRAAVHMGDGGGKGTQTEAAGGTSGAEGIGGTAGTETGSSGDCRGTGT